MLVNPFIVLAHPIKTIKDAIEKPDFNTAFFIVLMPTVLLIVFNLIAGVPLDLFSIARHGALNYLSWVIASCVFYFFAFLVAGKKIKGKFLAIMCSLSYIWFFVSIMMIVSFLLLIGSPKLIALQNVLQKESLTQEEVRVLYNILANRDSEALQNFERVHDISTDLSGYMLTEEEAGIINNITFFGFISGIVLMFYTSFLYPFLTLKLIIKRGPAATFVLYLIVFAALYFIVPPLRIF
ncbi:MAG: hypothetical protein J7J87_01900 [Candidatus Diapherotrites archaeon]|nr:hypothetical protein [Candidatus Diapherotrites archaeon]